MAKQKRRIPVEKITVQDFLGAARALVWAVDSTLGGLSDHKEHCTAAQSATVTRMLGAILGQLDDVRRILEPLPKMPVQNGPPPNGGLINLAKAIVSGWDGLHVSLAAASFHIGPVETKLSLSNASVVTRKLKRVTKQKKK